MYWATTSPGKTNDARAFHRCISLRTWLDNLPKEYFLIGDNAYTLTDNMMIPFSGAQRHPEQHRTYNFFLSQLRTQIECAFGRLTTKWRILRANLDSSKLENHIKVFRVAAKLHNFVIDHDSNNDEIESGTVVIEDEDDTNEELRIIEGSNDVQEGEESSETRRQSILNRIIDDGIQRPQHNLDRNGYI
jgi:hypothetical protein